VTPAPKTDDTTAVITAISPNTIVAGDVPTITLTGSHFRSGATVGMGGMPATGVEIVSATQIRAKAPAGLTVGSHSVSVTNVGESPVTLANGLTVQAAPIHHSGNLLFVSQRDGNSEIYSVSASGTNLTRLTTQSGSDDAPIWSATIGKVIFSTERDGGTEVYTMNADGSNPANVAGNDEIYAMNADGSGKIRLTNQAGVDTEPSLSPDGSKVIFLSTRDGNAEIYRVDVTGSDLMRLTTSVGASSFDGRAVWSPDGSKIGFISDRSGASEVYVMNPDGSTPIRLTTYSGLKEQLAWSPEGGKIAFVTQRNNRTELCLMNADGGNLINLTALAGHTGWDHSPTWSADGAKIAFVSSRGGNDDVYVMNADGSNPLNVSNDAAWDQQPCWR
jgi:TolB protein